MSVANRARSQREFRRRLALRQRNSGAATRRFEEQDRWRMWEAIITADPDDYKICVAHGFDVHHRDYEALCNNGCGLVFSDIIGGKIRKCPAPEPHLATIMLQEVEALLFEEFRSVRLG